MLAFGLILFGILSRFVIHAPNFTPVIAIALFSGVYLRKFSSLAVPLIMMVISDLVIGFHDTLFFTWGTIMLIALIGMWLRAHKSIRNIFLSALASSLLFFIITNLAAWPTLYPKTWAGLEECFIAAIPFYRNTLLSTVIYSALFFGLYEFVAARVRNLKVSKVLLAS